VSFDLKRLSSVFKLLVFAACIYYLVRTIAKVDPAQLKLVYIPIAAGTGLLYFLCTFLMAQSWRWLVLLFHHSCLSFAVLAPVYFRSALAKYIPSNVMHFAARHFMSRRFNISHNTILLSNLLEIAVILMAAVSIAAFFLLAAPQLLPVSIAVHRPLLRIVVAAGAGFILLGLLCIVRRKTSDLMPSWIAFLKTLGAAYGVNLIFLLLTGLVLSVLFYTMQTGLAFNGGLVVRIVFGYVCAWTIGFVTPGAPGGLGVREGVLTAVLGPFIGHDNALLGALLFRFCTFFGECLGYLFARILEHRYPLHRLPE
jgi:uncharacterized membrane protein YbhN (UPF0104 family)